jgi:hypothetical protein
VETADRWLFRLTNEELEEYYAKSNVARKKGLEKRKTIPETRRRRVISDSSSCSSSSSSDSESDADNSSIRTEKHDRRTSPRQPSAPPKHESIYPTPGGYASFPLIYSSSRVRVIIPKIEKGEEPDVKIDNPMITETTLVSKIQDVKGESVSSELGEDAAMFALSREIVQASDWDGNLEHKLCVIKCLTSSLSISDSDFKDAEVKDSEGPRKESKKRKM